MNDINFRDISFLKHGNARQQSAYKTLTDNDIFDKLKNYTPLLAGTIPINIDIPGSDLDILCFWTKKEQFIYDIKKEFEQYEGFILKNYVVVGNDTVISNFRIDDFELEIFGQNIPVTQQVAYRHMVIEHNLICERGEDFRRKIVELKKKGYKTEPAFAELLGLKGDPFHELLKFEKTR